MTRGPGPDRALAEAIPIAKARGIARLVMKGPERISGIRWVDTNPEEEKTAGLRLLDRFEDPGHVQPRHVRAGNPRGHTAAYR